MLKKDRPYRRRGDHTNAYVCESTLTEPDDHPPWARAEVAFLQEILAQAVRDLTVDSEREAAIEWLTQEADSDDAFTVPWICDYMNVDLEVIQLHIDKAIYGTASTVEHNRDSEEDETPGRNHFKTKRSGLTRRRARIVRRRY